MFECFFFYKEKKLLKGIKGFLRFIKIMIIIWCLIKCFVGIMLLRVLLINCYCYCVCINRYF